MKMVREFFRFKWIGKNRSTTFPTTPGTWMLACIQISSMGVIANSLTVILARIGNKPYFYTWGVEHDPGMSIVTAVALLVIAFGLFAGTLVYEIKKSGPEGS